MESGEKEVRYDMYCATCEYMDAVDDKGFTVQKCEECQSTPMNIDSHKPINYKEAKK